MDNNNATQAALQQWRDLMCALARGDVADLSVRQMAIMLMIYLDPPPHTVRGLAAQLNIGKPAVTRALDKLEKLEFVRRRPDTADKRSIIVQRTVKGSVFLSDYANILK